MAPTVYTVANIRLLLIYRPRKDKLAWLAAWPALDGLSTIVVTHQLQVEHRTGKVRRPKTDVQPLCQATKFVCSPM